MALTFCHPSFQEQNRRLRIELLALRQAARDAGLNSVLLNSTLLGVPDESLGLDKAAKQLAEGMATPEPGGGGDSQGDGAGRRMRRMLRQRTQKSEQLSP